MLLQTLPFFTSTVVYCSPYSSPGFLISSVFHFSVSALWHLYAIIVLTMLHCSTLQSSNSYLYFSCWTNGFIYKAEQMFLLVDVSVQFQLHGGSNRSILPSLTSTRLWKQWICVEVSNLTDISQIGNIQEKRSYLNYKVVLKCLTIRHGLNQCISLDDIFSPTCYKIFSDSTSTSNS